MPPKRNISREPWTTIQKSTFFDKSASFVSPFFGPHAFFWAPMGPGTTGPIRFFWDPLTFFGEWEASSNKTNMEDGCVFLGALPVTEINYQLIQSETGQKNMPIRTWTLGGLRLNMEQVFVLNIERTLTLTWKTQEH